jgi:uncharacterized protein (TIGR02246 family)
VPRTGHGNFRGQCCTFFAELAEAWNANDGAAIAEFFTEDGSLINPFGERADGRAALAVMYGEYFGAMLQGTTTAIALTRLRPVEADHVFSDADQTIDGPSGDVLLALHVSACCDGTAISGASWTAAPTRSRRPRPRPNSVPSSWTTCIEPVVIVPTWRAPMAANKRSLLGSELARMEPMRRSRRRGQ